MSIFSEEQFFGKAYSLCISCKNKPVHKLFAYPLTTIIALSFSVGQSALAIESGTCFTNSDLKRMFSKVEPYAMEVRGTKLTLKGKLVHNIIDKSEEEKPAFERIQPGMISDETRDKTPGKELGISKNQRAFFQSEIIIVAEFQSYENDVAHFKTIDYLKGCKINRIVPVRLDSFAQKEFIPQKKSKWIIFLTSQVPVNGAYETYHGVYGLRAYNEDNIDQVLRVIEQYKGQTRVDIPQSESTDANQLDDGFI